MKQDYDKTSDWEDQELIMKLSELLFSHFFSKILTRASTLRVITTPSAELSAHLMLVVYAKRAAHHTRNLCVRPTRLHS